MFVLDRRKLKELIDKRLPLVPVAFAVLCNVLTWIIVLLLLRRRTALLSTAVLAYTLGLRHAFDADHISAIDNLTRRLIEDGQRPVSVGLYFSVGHSTVVVLTSLVVSVTSAALADRFDRYSSIGGMIGTSVSMSFLLLIGLANCYVLYRQCKALRQRQIGQTEHNSSGIILRLCSRMFRLIDRPYKMYFLGVLFGLGFDTATEVALLAIASVQGTQGTPVYLIMVYPFLFTVGMMLVDTIDGAAMFMVYTSALQKNSTGRLYYSIILTAASVTVALVIGMIQMFSLILNTAHPTGSFWDGVERVSDNYSVIGGAIAGAFALIVVMCALIRWHQDRRKLVIHDQELCTEVPVQPVTKI